MDDAQLGMDQPRRQQTLASTAVVEGVGYWSGQDVRVEFRPAPPHGGVVFVRDDLPGCPRVQAAVANRFEMPRRTVLRRGEAIVEMVEHIMAALVGLQIDNCEVWVDRAEMPGCDGSCLPFVAALRQVGVVQQDAPRTRRMITRVIHLGNEESWIEARPGGAGRTVLQYELDYGSGSPIGRQSLEILLSPRFFHLNLAPSRTFLLEHEAAALRARGLGQRATPQDLLVFNAGGPIDNHLRFPDECVRHKIVDLIGDLGLAGCDFGGHFVAYRSGHRLNAELVRTIMAETDPQQQQWRRCA
jgi:UDP-3-O-[3-hydroxymyristoyl] N-acetylglucosamine deacetylase